jgi:hypothetical protein
MAYPRGRGRISHITLKRLEVLALEIVYTQCQKNFCPVTYIGKCRVHTGCDKSKELSLLLFSEVLRKLLAMSGKAMTSTDHERGY